MNDDTSDTSWDYPQNDVELEYVCWAAVEEASRKFDFFTEGPLNKLAWTLFATKYIIVQDLE